MSIGVGWISSDPLVLSRSVAFVKVKAEGGDFRPALDVIRQQSINDCGPAALANFLRAFGANPIPTADSIAVLAGTTPLGTKLRGLADAAHEVLGFMPTIERLRPTDIRAGDLPLIAWFDQEHFVVIESQEADGRFAIVDPLLGRYVLSRDALARHWTGEALWVPPYGARELPVSRVGASSLFPFLKGGHDERKPITPRHHSHARSDVGDVAHVGTAVARSAG